MGLLYLSEALVLNLRVKRETVLGALVVALLLVSSAQGGAAQASNASRLGDRQINISAPMLKYVGFFAKTYAAHKLPLKSPGGINLPSAWLFSKDGVLLLEASMVFHQNGKKDIVVNDVKSSKGNPNWVVFSEILEKAAAFKKQTVPEDAILLFAMPPKARCPSCASFERKVAGAAGKYGTDFRTIKLTVTD